MRYQAASRTIVIGICIMLFLVVLYIYGATLQRMTTSERHVPDQGQWQPSLHQLQFYRDPTRPYIALAEQLRSQGRSDDAQRMSFVASKPSSLWLTGPTKTDSLAERDVQTVRRTSKEAQTEGTVPIYILYAIPKRDACAGYSAGGFQTAAEYHGWIERIASALQTSSVFVVEPDALPQAVKTDCFSSQEVNDRYNMLKRGVQQLKDSTNARAVYIDAGHPEWFAEPKAIVPALKASGVDQANGVSVNVSNFVDTDRTVSWSQKLLQQLPPDKGAIIDTSRNGKGAPPLQDNNEARWCNPPGRGIGSIPTTDTAQSRIDAYIWAKNIGESDGDCFGHPPAGTFEPEVAVELARNASW